MASPRQVVGVDLETFSSVNLKTHGLDRYVNSPDFTILLCSLSYGQTDSEYTYDLVCNPDLAETLQGTLKGIYATDAIFAAHNAGFERASLRISFELPEDLFRMFMDSAVVARTQGAASSLANASRQLLPVTHKLDTGSTLIQKFCVPNEWNGGKPPTRELLMADDETWEQWVQFKEYCEVDAKASRELVEAHHPDISMAMLKEFNLERLTAEQNEAGWPVDMKLVKEMQLRYKQNVAEAKAKFRAEYDPNGELNFASPIQLKAWCKERGVNATGFDQEKVDVLVEKLRDKLIGLPYSDPKYDQYDEVYWMLKTKQTIGGASLKKLQTIIDTVGPDDRLRNQYLHCGAGQSYRTSGRGVQMQNLKRLDADLLDMARVFDVSEDLDNEILGANMRQVFTSSHVHGKLIVGDFSSVESRGLAWLAGADWKIEAYRQGKDMYKVLAAKLYGVEYEDVTKEQRKMGKLGELSCGYGAGKVAVGRMAGRQGLDLDEDASQEVVTGWRDTNPEVTELWGKLDDALHAVVGGASSHSVTLANALRLEMSAITTPDSLLDIHPNARSVKMRLLSTSSGALVLERVFHGCYLRGKNVAYYKPTERRTGALWSSHFVDPVTKQTRFFELYGGKLAGILTQSLCREMFFYGLEQLRTALHRKVNIQVIGQFHDEIVVDWQPPDYTQWKPLDTQIGFDEVLGAMEWAMTRVPHTLKGFPLAADIKHDYRYTK